VSSVHWDVGALDVEELVAVVVVVVVCFAFAGEAPTVDEPRTQAETRTAAKVEKCMADEAN